MGGGRGGKRGGKGEGREKKEIRFNLIEWKRRFTSMAGVINIPKGFS